MGSIRRGRTRERWLNVEIPRRARAQRGTVKLLSTISGVGLLLTFDYYLRIPSFPITAL